MQEYWVNVYAAPWNNNGQHIANVDKGHITRTQARIAAELCFTKCLYRIHVKMKPVKSKAYTLDEFKKHISEINGASWKAY